MKWEHGWEHGKGAGKPDPKEHLWCSASVAGAGAGFRCNVCGCKGAGFRYRCDACDFDLHEFCATCPPAALLPFHGQHPLTLLPAMDPVDSCMCDLCDTPIVGMRYSCRATDFDVHPICSQLPAAAVSPLHPVHLVVLTMAKATTKCTHCSTDCSWRYRCSPCGVNLRPRCLLGSDETPLGIPKAASPADSSSDEASD